MSSEDIIRAWKDPDRPGEGLADHPAGQVELEVVGGDLAASWTDVTCMYGTYGCCWTIPTWCIPCLPFAA